MDRKRILFTILLAASCAGCAREEAPRAVFLIVVDTLRPDRLSCYGYAEHETPHIDGLAMSGVRFTRAYAAASWTVPSMGAMMTSRYPTQLGLIEKPTEKTDFIRRERRDQVLSTVPLGAVTLAEIMRERGFRTTAFVNQPFLNIYDGFLQGFERWCYPNADGASWHDPSIPLPTLTQLPPGVEGGDADALLVDAFVKWVEQAGSGRHFVWLHLLRPHSPYNPAPEFLSINPAMATMTQSYAGEVRETDAEIGRVVDAIEDRFGLANCVLIFTSDHGEAFGEHGGVEHGHSLHTEVTHVPLIVCAPGLTPGDSVNCHTGTLDILPTLVDMTGGDSSRIGNIEGKSLLGAMAGDCKGEVYSEGMLYEGTERSLIRGDLRAMYDEEADPPFTVYDVGEDPLELIDITQRDPERAAAMQQALVSLHTRLLNDLAVTLSREENAMTEEQRDRVMQSLRALGYIK